MRVGLWAFAAVAVASFIGWAGHSASGATGTFAQAAAVPAGLTRPGFIYLLTDGTVMAHDLSGQDQNWWRLTPDNTDSYANGTWTQLASIPASFNYGPRFYAAAVLPDGRLAIEGGEFNLGAGLPAQLVNLGAIYNPKTNQWLKVRQPFGWTQIGDAQAVVLPSGQWMLSDSQNTSMALFNANNLTWTPTGFNFRACINDEAGWTLLADGSLFTTDNNIAAGCGGTQNGERWVPGSSGRPIGTWYLADNGTGTQQLFDNPGLPNLGQEMGPQVLLPNKTVLAIGATGNVSIYTPPAVTRPASTLPGSWANTTKLPAKCGTPNSQCAANDAPASLLPNGNVLLFAGPAGTAANEFPLGSHFYEFDSNFKWTPVTEPAALTAQIQKDPSYYGQLLMLPNGQVLFTDGIGNSSNVWVYTPDPTLAPNPAWVPTITAFPASITRGSTYNISGTLFNGVSQANYYGDDSQNATNYPIIQVTINASGHVYYGRTHDHSSMGVNLTGVPVATKFELLPCPQPVGASCVAETGVAKLVVIANGIKSAPVNVTIN